MFLSVMLWCAFFECVVRGVAAVRRIFSEIENLGLLCRKVPCFRGKSTDVLPREVRCFCFPENAVLLARVDSDEELWCDG